MPTRSTLFVLGDSFARGVAASHAWLSYVPQLSDYLGFDRFIADGVVGAGWITRAGTSLTNFLDRVNDVTDRSVKRRNSLSAFGLSHATGILILGGINDNGFTTQQITTQANLVLNQIQQVCSGVPLYVTGPQNPPAPASYAAGLKAVDDGVRAACFGRQRLAYINIEGMVFDQVGNGNIHPVDSGMGQIATYLQPLILSATGAMV